MKNKHLFDYQWPSAFTQKNIFDLKKKKNDNKKYIIKIENFFYKRFGYQTKLFPSGRAAIAVILRYLKINRSNQVYTDKWSSHCLFNTIGAYTNVCTTLNRPDLVVCIHKWGIIKKIRNKRFKIIEDSVDSIINKPKALFPNKGEFEIFSLPKIIGSISGGLVVSKNKDFIKYCNLEQKKNIDLGIYQAVQKYNDINKKKSFNTWLYNESWNTYLDYNSLSNIQSCIKNYDINKKIINTRLNQLKLKLKLNINNKQRLGPVLALPIKKFSNIKVLKKKLLIRHHSNSSFKKLNFYKYFLLPLHFRITNKKFKSLSELIYKNYKI